MEHPLVQLLGPPLLADRALGAAREGAMNRHLDDGHMLARRIADAHAQRIYALPEADRAAFIAGLVSGMVGVAAGFLTATAVVPLLEQLLKSTADAAALETTRDHAH